MSVASLRNVLLVGVAVAGSATLSACDAGGPGEGRQPLVTRTERQLLSPAKRLERATIIRDTARANGIEQGWLLAGIANAETQMSHCWSELTWACKGPASADCGGGPVVAGAGDGPCSLQEGGLGMFQFDGGTFDQTLARDGHGILSVSGNTDRAVDFVVDMVIRSQYVNGVSTRADAITWLNGVRIDNGRFDPWVKTITHYYNGCRPSYSCWSQRYAHYRDNQTMLYREFGEGFWGVADVLDFAGESLGIAGQSYPIASQGAVTVEVGQTVTGWVELKNTGDQTWEPGVVWLAPVPRDQPSEYRAANWGSGHRISTVAAPVAPGQVGRFQLDITGSQPGERLLNLGWLAENITWFADVPGGGPSDGYFAVRINTVPAGEPPVSDPGSPGIDDPPDGDPGDREPPAEATPGESEPPAPAGTCAEIAEARGWQNFACETARSNDCNGRGIASSDCDVCCGSTCSYDSECGGNSVCSWSGAEYCCKPAGERGKTCFNDDDCSGDEVCGWNGERFVCGTHACTDRAGDAAASGGGDTGPGGPAGDEAAPGQDEAASDGSNDSGCSMSHSRTGSGAPWALLMMLVGLLTRRRRRPERAPVLASALPSRQPGAGTR